MKRIAIVEDTECLREALRAILCAEGFSVDAYCGAEEAFASILRNPPAAIVSDLKLPRKNGVELLKELRAAGVDAPFIVMTAFGTIETAVEAMREGAANFITKPFEPRDLIAALRDMLLAKSNGGRAAAPGSGGSRPFVTQDLRTQNILKQAAKAAPVDTSVLILGESGTGKEVLARLIHDKSARRTKSFAAINCAALQPGLMESEFFGHEAGAFTGADQPRIGLLEYASEGTLFLDELAEMPVSLQVKLLRALQEREVRRLGGNRTIKINPRIIAATNRDINESLAAGTLREDLYYRVAVVSFKIPPLRERREDIMPLIEHYLQLYAAANNKIGIEIDPAAINVLRRGSWPGNARQLENVIERAVIMASDIILPEHLGLDLSLDFDALHDASETLPQIAETAAKAAEINFITKVLRDTRGNKLKASRILGVSYKTLLNKVKEYKLESSFEESSA